MEPRNLRDDVEHMRIAMLQAQREAASLNSTEEKSKFHPMDREVTTKDYIDRSMDAVRAQNDVRFAEVLAEVKNFHADMSTQFASIGSRLDVVAMSASQAQAAAEKSQSASEKAEAAARSTKWNIVATAIGVAAVLVALWALWGSAIQMTLGIVSAIPQDAPVVEQATPPAPAPESPTE